MILSALRPLTCCDTDDVFQAIQTQHCCQCMSMPRCSGVLQLSAVPVCHLSQLMLKDLVELPPGEVPQGSGCIRLGVRLPHLQHFHFTHACGSSMHKL